MPDRSRCPSCGERVSPYAAGCAVCGADLDTARWDTGPSRARQASSWMSAISFGAIPTWGIWLIIIVIAAVVYRVL